MTVFVNGPIRGARAAQGARCADRGALPGRRVARGFGRLAALLAPWLLAAGCTTSGGPAAPAAPAAGSQDAARASANTGFSSLSTDPASVMPEAQVDTEQRRRARIRVELGASYYQQGNYPVALEELRQALTIDPSYSAAYGMLGLVYMDLNDRARAEDSFQRALRLAPNDPELLNNYGWYLCQTGREQQSLEYFQRASANPLYTTPARPMHNAGICALRVGDEKAAEEYFLRSFQLDPSNPVAMYNLGEMYLKRGEITRARFYSQRLLQQYEPSAQVLWLALRVERRAGNRDAEASLATQLRRRFPQSREVSLLNSGNFGN